MPELKTNCVLSFSSTQFIDDDEEKITFTVPAYRTEINGNHYLRYSVFYDEEKLVPCHETLKITKNGEAEIIRTGFIKSKMIFKVGDSTVSSYSSPAGEMYISITTKEVDTNINDKELTLSVIYTLVLDNNYKLEVHLNYDAINNEG